MKIGHLKVELNSRFPKSHCIIFIHLFAKQEMMLNFYSFSGKQNKQTNKQNKKTKQKKSVSQSFKVNFSLLKKNKQELLPNRLRSGVHYCLHKKLFKQILTFSFLLFSFSRGNIYLRESKPTKGQIYLEASFCFFILIDWSKSWGKHVNLLLNKLFSEKKYFDTYFFLFSFVTHRYNEVKV